VKKRLNLRNKRIVVKMSKNETDPEVEKTIETFKKNFKEIYIGKVDNLANVFQNAKIDVLDYESIAEFKRKFTINFLKEITFMLKNTELKHQDFILNSMKDKKIWQPIAKLILLQRILELKSCKVLKKGKKYDITDLRNTLLGKMILDRLDFTRRSILNEDEYVKIISAIKKLKYDNPVEVQPTETEKFFEK